MGLLAFRTALVVAWCINLYICVMAAQVMSPAAGMALYFADYDHWWRAQFNTDLLIHVILSAIWIFWRSRTWAIGLFFVILTILGSLFTLAYIFVLTFTCQGDMRKLVLGRHADPA